MNGDYLYRYLYICANQMNADEVIRVKYKDESLIVKELIVLRQSFLCFRS